MPATNKAMSVDRIKELFESSGIKLGDRSANLMQSIIQEDFEAEEAEAGLSKEVAVDLSDELSDMIDELSDIADDLASPEEREAHKEAEEEKKDSEEIDNSDDAAGSDEPEDGAEEAREQFGESRPKAVLARSADEIAESLMNGTFKANGAKGLTEILGANKSDEPEQDDLDKLLNA